VRHVLSYALTPSFQERRNSLQASHYLCLPNYRRDEFYMTMTLGNITRDFGFLAVIPWQRAASVGRVEPVESAAPANAYSRPVAVHRDRQLLEPN
jgi:hypothetical protein